MERSTFLPALGPYFRRPLRFAIVCTVLPQNCGQILTCPRAAQRKRPPRNKSKFSLGGVSRMCRNIKTLFNFDPPVSEEEVRAASLQFVRKISGFQHPSKANERPFLAAVDKVATASMSLLRSLETNAPPKNRQEEAAKAKARAALRFGT